MRTKYQLQVRRARVKNTNELLVWLEKNRKLSGQKVYEEVVVPFSEETGLDRFEVWKAWDILRGNDRCKAFSCWRWEILSTEPVVMLEDGSIK